MIDSKELFFYHNSLLKNATANINNGLILMFTR